jgi:large subunit ribosomal protein L24
MEMKMSLIEKLSTKLKVGDKVVVTTGKWSGKSGKIESILKKANKVLVSGVNTVKRHQKPSMSNQAGGIIDKAMPMAISNVAFLDKNDKATKIGYKEQDGKKVRFAKSTGDLLD